MTLENNLYGLSFGCPYIERMEDYPLKEMDHLSFIEKISWINQLTKDEKQKILNYHKNCSKNRFLIRD